MKPTISKPTSGVPAIDRLCLILDLITQNSHALTSAEIAETLNLPRSSTHNILQSLLTKHLVFKDRDNRFHLGSHLLYWSGKYEQTHPIIQIFNEEIIHYPNLTKHMITLSKLDDSKLGCCETVVLECRESSRSLGFYFDIGVRVPAAFSATGKAILACYTEPKLKDMFKAGMPSPLTRNSVRTLEELLDEVAEIRQSGISLDNGQLREGMYCMGTSIKDAKGTPLGGMAVSFFEQEYTEHKEEVSDSLKSLAKKISLRLGVDVQTS